MDAGRAGAVNPVSSGSGKAMDDTGIPDSRYLFKLKTY